MKRLEHRKPEFRRVRDEARRDRVLDRIRGRSVAEITAWLEKNPDQIPRVLALLLKMEQVRLDK